MGFIQAGFTCIGAYDIDPLAVSVHRCNLRSPAAVCDLSELPSVAIPSYYSDIVIAGPPCQGFSTIGKRRFDDPRNELLIVAANIGVRIRPKVFIAENVTGVISGKHKIYWEQLRGVLKNAGYKTLDLRLNGTALGIAQQRKRIVMIAWLKDRRFIPNLPQLNPLFLRDVLGNLEGKPNHQCRVLDKNSDSMKIALSIRPGQKLSNVRAGPRSVHTWDIPSVFGVTSPIERDLLATVMRLRRSHRVRDFGDADPVPRDLLLRQFGPGTNSIIRNLIRKRYLRNMGMDIDLTQTFNGKYRRLSWSAPSPTVDTRFGDPKYFLHPEEQRGFTVREAARIQGFPDSFIFQGPENKQFKMIGNAVPPPMAKAIGTLIAGLL